MTEAEPARHILVVDDEPVILQVLRAVFEDEPYRLSCVGTGREALRVIEEQGCDLLLTDKNLPDISGIELLEHAKRRDPLCEVIIITGYASLETAIQALELDAFDYVLKPLDNVFEIRRKVRQALEKRRIALENRRLVEDLRRRNEELEQALRETRELQAELIQSEKLAGIGTLAAGIAHEISSPLFGILGLAEAIADETDIAEARAHAREIVRYCETIREIVSELTSYTRASDADFAETIALRDVVEDALQLVRRSAHAEGVRFEVDLPADLAVHMRANEARQVFVNLLKNAAEAVRERWGGSGEGRVRVTARAEGGQVAAEVRDNGVGIPEEHLGEIFDPFYTTKPPGRGTGLGLNVVYRILTKYRGTVSVESRPGEGAVFCLRMPAGQRCD